jgi:membrane protease YdiL (CAAX protease family)
VLAASLPEPLPPLLPQAATAGMNKANQAKTRVGIVASSVSPVWRSRGVTSERRLRSKGKMTGSQAGPRWPIGSRARLGHAIGCVIVQMLLNAMCFGVIVPLLLHAEEPSFDGAPAEFVAVAVMAAIGAGLGVGLTLCALGRVRLADLGWRPPASTDIVPGLLGFAVCALVVLASRAVTDGSEGARSVLTAIAAYSPAQRLLFAAIGIGAAFSEESIFRGYLQPALVARIGSAGGIAASAAVFSLYHARFRAMSLIGLAAFGVVFGVLRARRGGLVAPALAHGLVWAVLGSA